MHYAYRFRLKPTTEQRELLDHHRDTCRQLYNHALREFNKIPESAGTLNQRVRQVRDQLTDLKEWWDEVNYPTLSAFGTLRVGLVRGLGL
jgi:putative transposase